MNKAIGYIRVSTQQQAEEGVSLEAQRAKIEAWCVINDYELTNVYCDSGISGTKSDRPELLAALEHTTKDTALICYSLSRLTRSTKDMLQLSEELNRKGANLVSLTEKIDTLYCCIQCPSCFFDSLHEQCKERLPIGLA